MANPWTKWDLRNLTLHTVRICQNYMWPSIYVVHPLLQTHLRKGFYAYRLCSIVVFTVKRIHVKGDSDRFIMLIRVKGHAEMNYCAIWLMLMVYQSWNELFTHCLYSLSKIKAIFSGLKQKDNRKPIILFRKLNKAKGYSLIL